MISNGFFNFSENDFLKLNFITIVRPWLLTSGRRQPNNHRTFLIWNVFQGFLESTWKNKSCYFCYWYSAAAWCTVSNDIRFFFSFVYFSKLFWWYFLVYTNPMITVKVGGGGGTKGEKIENPQVQYNPSKENFWILKLN